MVFDVGEIVDIEVFVDVIADIIRFAEGIIAPSTCSIYHTHTLKGKEYFVSHTEPPDWS